MKHTSKTVKDKQKTLGPQFDLVDIQEGTKDPYLAEKSDRQYIIVKEFSGIGEAAEESISINNDQEPDIEYDKNGNPIYYAEEVFDEDDDLYSETFNDRQIVKEAHRTYSAIGESIDSRMTNAGYQTKFGFDLLCAMRFSRLINLKTKEGLVQFVEKFFISVSNPHYVSKQIPDQTFAYDSCLYDSIVHAKNNPNVPVFVYIYDVNPIEFYKYLRPIYPYIDNHNGDFYVTTRGRSIVVPKNLYILYSLKEGEQMCDVSRRILRYTSIIDPVFESIQPGEYSAPLVLSLGELEASFKEASEEYGLRESAWKKIDNLVNLIHSVNGYVLHNKIVSRLENYSIVRLSSKETEDQVLDDLLEKNFIVESIITENPIVYVNDKDIINLIDGSFGMENMHKTKTYIKSYLDLFDKGGKRKNA